MGKVVCLHRSAEPDAETKRQQWDELGLAGQARLRLEWLRAGQCYERANLEVLVEGHYNGHYTWDEIGTTDGEMWRLIRRFEEVLCPQADNKAWVMRGILRQIHPDAGEHACLVHKAVAAG